MQPQINADARRFELGQLQNLRSSALFRGFDLFARDIKLSHTIFAMPWAILATFMAADGMPRVGQLGLIVLCMVAARTVAMSSNRLLDAGLDARNPRTAGRSLPSGQLSRTTFVLILLACALVFIGATSLFGFAYQNWLPLILAIPVLAFIAMYPLLKRATAACHFYLGAALALAPICAWIAISGKLDVTPFLMGGAVLFWTAGFDIIYACQDYRSDLETGTFSLPARLGIGFALWVSRASHLGCVMLLIILGLSSHQLGTLYVIGVVATVLLLVIEQGIVKPDDLSKVGVAFFTVNGLISLLLGTLGVIDVFL